MKQFFFSPLLQETSSVKFYLTDTISCSFCKLPLSSACKCMELQEQFEIIILILYEKKKKSDRFYCYSRFLYICRKRLGLLSRVCQMAALPACRHRISNFIKQICEQYSSHACLPHLEQVYIEYNNKKSLSSKKNSFIFLFYSGLKPV